MSVNMPHTEPYDAVLQTISDFAESGENPSIEAISEKTGIIEIEVSGLINLGMIRGHIAPNNALLSPEGEEKVHEILDFLSKEGFDQCKGGLWPSEYLFLCVGYYVGCLRAADKLTSSDKLGGKSPVEAMGAISTLLAAHTARTTLIENIVFGEDDSGETTDY